MHWIYFRYLVIIGSLFHDETKFFIKRLTNQKKYKKSIGFDIELYNINEMIKYAEYLFYACIKYFSVAIILTR